MEYYGILINAHNIASKVHLNQTRADGVEPYINHCKRVASIIDSKFAHWSSESVLSAAFLHDSLEDCEENEFVKIYQEIYEQCNPTIAAWVDMLSKPRDHKHYKNKRYLARLAIAPKQVIVIKLADRLDNLQSIPTTDWDIKRILSYITDSVNIYKIACDSGCMSEARSLMTQIILTESYINTLNLRK